MNAIKIQEEIDQNRRSVAFDSYDITVRQLYDMIVEGLIEIAPEYQRHFVWDRTRQSQLIESLLLGIPVPNLFMATNKDSTWEVIDGLQRLTTVVNFVGEDQVIKKVNESGVKLIVDGLDKLESINGLTFDQLPKSVQLMFMTRPIRVTVLNDRSDFEVRYDLFERLNTGGVSLHPQEIRNCVFLGRFKDFIVTCSQNEDFLAVVKMTKKQEITGNREELVLKFFAYLTSRDEFIHSVKGFLNDYMEKMTKSFPDIEQRDLLNIFNNTFALLNRMLPHGIVREPRVNTTPLILYEAISIGVAELIRDGIIDQINQDQLIQLLNDNALKRLTTGATNSRRKLYDRIDYVIENAIG